MFVLLLVSLYLNGVNSVIYRLNDSQYAMMPPIMQYDSYDACQKDDDGLYCTAEFALVSDRPSSLLDMIKGYSEHRPHFNHSKLRYGICVTQRCAKFKGNGDLNVTLEACLNETLSEKYELKVKILDEYHCKSPRSFFIDIDATDIIVGTICVLLLVINVIGSLVELFLARRKDKTANLQSKIFRLLLCFSLQRNWRRLLMPFARGNPRIQQLKALHGMRVITTFLTIAVHALLPCLAFVKNPQFLKEFYSVKPLLTILNGTLIMQTFLVMSSFLLVYPWLMHSEKHRDSWYLLPMQIFLRWLRLTPSYALIIALTATWFPRLATGPVWHKYVAVEMNDCRQHWWKNILYINNYFNDSKCMLQCWYLATDMHLYILAAIIYLSCRTSRSRKVVLLSLFVVGTLVPAAQVYFQDLDGILLLIPEDALNMFFSQPHFNYQYKCSHSNIVGCVVGVAIGYLVYLWQQNGIRIENYQTPFYRMVYWSLFPLGALCCYSGYIFFEETPRPSVYVRTLYAAILKPAFSLLVGGAIVGCIFKIEDVYRGVLEWPGWTILSRLSYSAYLLHMMVIKTYTASLTETFQVGYITLITTCSSLVVVSFVAAVFFWLIVEAPLNNFVKECLSKPEIEEKKTK